MTKKSSKRQANKNMKKRRKRRGGIERLLSDLRSKSAEIKAAIKELKRYKTRIQKEADSAIADIDAQINMLSIYAGSGVRSAGAGPIMGRRKRMSAEDKATAKAAILKAAEGAKGGLKRAGAIEAAGVSPLQASSFLAELVKEKELKVAGKKAGAKYFAT